MNIKEEKIENNIITTIDNANLKEKVVCKNCNNIIFRDLEQYNIYTDILNKEKQDIYAVFIKKFKCSKCKSIEFNSYICDISLLPKENEKLNSEVNNEINKEPEIININLKSKRTRKKNTIVVNA